MILPKNGNYLRDNYYIPLEDFKKKYAKMCKMWTRF